MSATLTVTTRALGRRKPLLADWSIPFPPELGTGGAVTVRALITQVVQAEVASFKERQHTQRFLQVLTERQIADAATKGAIRSGGSEVGEQPVNPEAAVETAIQAFVDGLFLIIVDEQEQRELDREVTIRPGSRVSFLRLTLLAGG